MRLVTHFLLYILVTINVNADSGVISAFIEGLFGSPSFFQKQPWKFDPDISSKRNPEFEAVNGHRSVNLIERFGLGIDGNMAERQRENTIRDTQTDPYVLQ